MIQKSGDYVHGTSAEKLEYNIYEENRVLKSKKVSRSYLKAKVKAVILILVLFAACFAVVVRYAQITEINYDINKAVKTYNSIRNENARLLVEIKKETDLTKIKEIAETRLEMQKPDKYQIVYVNVPKGDYTIVAENYDQSSKTNDNFFAVLFDKVNKLISLLY